jgi:prephenate dehydratase
MTSKIGVVYLGPPGSFSEKVVLENFEKNNIELIPAKGFYGIFDSVEKEEADCGVVPTEDSIDGDVNESLDFLEHYNLYIIGELYLKVTCALLGRESIDKLKVISSHPKLLRNCQKYLKIHLPNLSIKPVQSTSEAMRLAVADLEIGALADEEQAEPYGLKVLCREPHDYGYHITRFLVLARRPLDWTPSEEFKKRAIRAFGDVYFVKEQ